MTALRPIVFVFLAFFIGAVLGFGLGKSFFASQPPVSPQTFQSEAQQTETQFSLIPDDILRHPALSIRSVIIDGKVVERTLDTLTLEKKAAKLLLYIDSQTEIYRVGESTALNPETLALGTKLAGHADLSGFGDQQLLLARTLTIQP